MNNPRLLHVHSISCSGDLRLSFHVSCIFLSFSSVSVITIPYINRYFNDASCTLTSVNLNLFCPSKT